MKAEIEVVLREFGDTVELLHGGALFFCFRFNFVGLRPFAKSQLFLSLFMFSLAFLAPSSHSSPPFF